MPRYCRLLVGELGEVDAQGVEVEPRHLLVEVLRQGVDPNRVVGGLGEELDLRDGLVGERVGHDKTWVTGGVAEVEQPSLAQDEHGVAVGEVPQIDLRLDVLASHARSRGETSHVDLVVEVADVADDRLVLHLLPCQRR